MRLLVLVLGAMLLIMLLALASASTSPPSRPATATPALTPAPTSEPDPKAADVKVLSLEIDVGACHEHYPIRATIRNDAQATLREATLDIEVYESGRSKNLVAYRDGRLDQYDGSFVLDYVLSPGETSAFCFRMPHLINPAARNVLLGSKISSARFYRPGEFIPKRAADASAARAP